MGRSGVPTKHRRHNVACLAASAAVPSWGARGTQPPLGGGSGRGGGMGRSGVPTKHRRHNVACLAASAAVPSWGARGTQPPLGGGGNGMGRSRVPTKLRIGAPREVEVLCPPVRMARYGASLETWCEENGERGARLLEEYADTEKSAREVTKGSDDKALWNCRDCGHEWLARVGNRTRSGGKRKPTDCPACSGYGTSLETWCEENGERGAKLLAEYADTEKGAREVTKASEHKALWSCRDCGHEWRATVKGRTKSDRPNGCPDCNRGGRPRKPIQL